MTPLMSLQNVHCFVEGKAVLREIAIDLFPNEVVGIIGPNGAGKSSLLKTMSGLLDECTGMLTLDGEPLMQIPALQRARKLAYLPQAADAAWPMPVCDIVTLGGMPHAEWTEHERRLRVHDVMQNTDTLMLSERSVDSLSGGEKMRVMIARLLMSDASLLLADEPTAALDCRHQHQIMQLFRSQARRGKTVVLVEHDLNVAAHYCDRLLLLHQGRLLSAGTPANVLQPELLATAYGVSFKRVQADGTHWWLPDLPRQ